MRLAQVFGFACALGALGCSKGDPVLDSSTPPDAAVAPDDLSEPILDLARPSKEAGGPCQEADPPDGGQCLLAYSGQVVDESGSPIAGALVSVCGSDCYSDTSAADGSFHVAIDHQILWSRWALIIHGRPDRVTYYVPLPRPPSKSVSVARPFVLPLLPKTGTKIALDGSAQVLTSGDLTLTIPGKTKVMLDVEDLANGDPGKQFRVFKAADPKALAFIDATSPPTVLYAVSPFESTYSQKVQVEFANSASLPPGAAVDVLEQVGLYDPPPAGTFVKLASAHVSMDGKKITMDPGEGLTTLTWIALRKSP